MNKLEQLRQRSQVVADTGDIEAIRRYRPHDATTNPSLLYKAAQLPQYRGFIDDALQWADRQTGDRERLAAMKLAVSVGREILNLVPGVVSTEVDARLSFDTRASIEYARRLVALYEQAGVERERVLIKLASTWEGIAAASVLEREGIHCNLTLLFSFSQAVACAEAGVTLISPFVGRILDWHKARSGRDDIPADEDPGVASVRRIYDYYKSRDYPTVVMGASFRNTGEIEALAGCDRLTISPQLLDELEQDQGQLAAGLPAATAREPRPEQALDEAAFRYQLNGDAMATEKLAEGIRNFVHDQEQLEAMLAGKSTTGERKENAATNS
ncbi:transaldolase [Microbulbifer yueqingensis]|uniref:Transaldolase n=1 Tax=Microbulbifer yueqingensis TaxID=658219 RepID=A0A1G8VN87_9GAMM|nr:transaldolase [Microbulbifer yueqingensis]SDJ67442.1 transaldolase [Microbulbifer yueqingensis]